MKQSLRKWAVQQICDSRATSTLPSNRHLARKIFRLKYNIHCQIFSPFLPLLDRHQNVLCTFVSIAELESGRKVQGFRERRHFPDKRTL